MIIKNIIRVFFGRIFLIVIQFIALLITNRLLEAGGRGLYASAITWTTLLFTIFYLSINIMYLKKCADNNEEKQTLKNGFFTLSILLSLAAIVVAIVFYHFFNENFIILPRTIFLLNILAIPFMIIQSLAISVYQSEHDFKKVNIVMVFSGAVNLILIIASYFFIKFDVTVYSAICLISWVFCSVYCMVTCRFQFSISLLKKIFDKRLLIDFWFLHLSTIMSFVVSGFNIILLHKFISDKEVGQYFLASTIIGYILFIPISIQSVLVANLIDKDNDEKLKLTSDFFRTTLVIMLILLIIIFFCSDIIIMILGGKSFPESAFYLRCLLFTAIFQVAGIIWSSLWNIRGYFKIVTRISIIIVLLSIILNYILIKNSGVAGALITTNIVTFLSMLVHLYIAAKEFKSKGRSIIEIIPTVKDFNYIKQNFTLFILKRPKSL